MTHAKTYLDAFGPYQDSYLVARGNHDRPHTGSESATCTAVPGAAGYHDCFRDTFFPEDPTWFAHEHRGLRIIGLDTYDKIGSGGDNGVMSARSSPSCATSWPGTRTSRPSCSATIRSASRRR